MQEFVATSFKPHRNGLNQVLGDLEQDIMEVLWKMEEAIVRDVFIELKKRRKIAYTTVMTVMGRLANKGILRKTPIKNSYLYKPVYSKDAFEKCISREVMKGILGNYTHAAVTSFIDVLSEIDPKQIEFLSNLIEEKKREIKKGDKKQ